jgi:16S rRNA (cytosine1402-N4)-methyltransferase
VTTQHLPVMSAEVLEALRPRPGGRYVDGTLGGAGHTAALLEASVPDGRVLALDADAAAIARGRDTLRPYGARVTLVQANFREIGAIAAEHGFVGSDGVVLDLGLSSDQLAASERGFSFQADGPLDMRYDRARGETAADLLNTASETELADIFFYYGEERRSRRLARVVVDRRAGRPFARTGDLVAAVEAALGGRRGRLHPATRTFQALRIAVNQELDALREALDGAVEILAPHGRLAVIAFHSLEDRIVKQFLRAHAEDHATPPLRPLTKKPLTPSPAEQAANPRARSAKLRAAERLPDAEFRVPGSGSRVRRTARSSEPGTRN